MQQTSPGKMERRSWSWGGRQRRVSDSSQWHGGTRAVPDV